MHTPERGQHTGAAVQRQHPNTDARRARANISRPISTGTLCTLALEPEGYPYGSLVTVAFENGDPIFLISRLAEHTKNLERDPRASLLVAEGGSAVRSPAAASPCWDRARASERMADARAPRSSPLIRTQPTTLTSAISRSGSCTWITSATLGAMAGCRGSAKPTGGPPNRIRWVRRPPA